MIAAAIVAAVSATAGALATASQARSGRSQARTSGSHHVLKMIWGDVNLPNGQSAFPIYHKLGVQVFQVELNWAQVAPTKPANAENPNDPAYVWPASVAQALRQAARYHIKVCILVLGAPTWATGMASPWTGPTHPSDYASFLIAAAHHYGSVRDWMIWGEPNRNVNFWPMPANSPVGPRHYALLLNAAYDALKGVSRKNIVIGGNNASYGTVNPADFVHWMKLPNGKPPPMDYFGLNPYSARPPEAHQYVCCKGGRDIDDLSAMESQLKRIYHRTVPLWLSEFTVSTNHNNRAFPFHVSRAEQARWVTGAYKLVNSLPFVVSLGWFNLIDQPPTAGNWNLTTGLMTWKLQPKPAFYAYEHVR